MMLPLIPIAAGAAGLLGGAWLGGKSKKEILVEEHAAYEHFAPAYGAQIYAPSISDQLSVQQSYVGATYIIDSPFARSDPRIHQEGELLSKQVPTIDAPVSGAPRTDMAGVDMNKLALIAVVGAVAIMGIGAVGKTQRRIKK